MKKKLIIWDFDGVIADTEKLWLKNRQALLKESMGVDWDWQTVEHYLKGMSDYTKREVLDSLGIITDDAFWEKSIEMDKYSMEKIGFELTDGIEDIFKLPIKQCIATGGLKDKTARKIEIVGIKNYFPTENVFTADMVERGKPDPDLFLLAAKSLNENPTDCIVVEDSVAGLTAALRAGCLPIWYFDGIINENNPQIKKVRDIGVKNIFNNMIDIKNFILTLF